MKRAQGADVRRQGEVLDVVPILFRAFQARTRPLNRQGHGEDDFSGSMSGIEIEIIHLGVWERTGNAGAQDPA